MTKAEFYRIFQHEYFDFGRLKSWRCKRGYSSAWIARNADLPIQEYDLIEEGVITPSLEVMETLCRLLKISLEDLYW